MGELADQLFYGSRLSPGPFGGDGPTPAQKWIAASVLGLLFGIVSSPVAYSLTDAVTSRAGVRTSKGGGPTLPGLILHSVVFALIVRILLW